MSRGVAGAGADEEREAKLAVPAGFVLPSANDLAPARVEDRGEKVLHSVYWDTDDLVLARTHRGLRHRNGVWTYKGPSRREGHSVIREEHELRAAANEVPQELAHHVAAVAPADRLRPVAELSNRRRTIDIRDGERSVELVHDRVTVLRGNQTVSEFAEVEVEFDAPSGPLADRVVGVLIARGAVVSGTGKYSRALAALGHSVPGWTAPAGAGDEAG